MLARAFTTMSDNILKVKLNHNNAILPVRSTKKAAGLDLFSCEDVTVPARKHLLVNTGIQIAIPTGHYGRVAPRSGLAYKHGIDVGAGVIDEDYRGNVGVILFNHTDTDYSVKQGERIAQLILEKISYSEAILVDSLENTERGDNGYGSTGKFNLNH